MSASSRSRDPGHDRAHGGSAHEHEHDHGHDATSTPHAGQAHEHDHDHGHDAPSTPHAGQAHDTLTHAHDSTPGAPIHGGADTHGAPLREPDRGHVEPHDGHDHAHHGGHDHDHRHAARQAGETRLVVLLVLVVAYIGVEVAGGLWANSLALLADAGHMVSDAAALGITLWALRIARRPTTPERTFGWHRAEILAAAVNGAALLAIAGGILWEAVERSMEPATTAGALVLAIATGGLLVNLVGLALLHSGRETSINLRGAWLHVLSDAMGSAGAMLAGACAWAFGWRWVDPLASALIAVLVLRSAWRLLNDAVDVLMEGAPRHLDTRTIRAALVGTPGVVGVHDLHVWTITSDLVAMSGHVVVAPEIDAGEERTRLLHALTLMLRARFGIEHATIQIEPPGFDAHAELHP